MKRNAAHSGRMITLGAIVGLGLLSFGSNAHGATASEGAPGDWLSRYAGARTLGLGGAFVAAADEPMGVVWNPAGLSFMYQNQVQFETSRMFEGTSINALSFAVPARTLPSLGLTILALRSGDIERTTELNEPLGTFSETDLAFLFSASKSLFTRLSIGANFKVVRQGVEEFDATGFGADIGLLYDLTPSVRLGASFLNIGGPSVTLRQTDETFPMEVRGGIAITALSGRALLSTELNHMSYSGTSVRAGTEVWIHPKMAVRVGYRDSNPTGGLSFRATDAMRIDYGLADHDLGITHRLGLTFSFGGFYASSKADPEVFSPVGQNSITKFHLKARTKGEAAEWSLEVVDKFNEVIRRFGGKGTPPAHLVWDGKGATGLPLPDGEYEYRLTVRDMDGREITGPVQTVEISTGGPSGTVEVG